MDRGRKPSVLGMISGAVAGLVAITPASGYVDPMGALIIGVAAGAVCYLSAVWMKRLFKYDDALDAWGVHGVGGALGRDPDGRLRVQRYQSFAKGWLADGNLHQMLIQIIDVGAVFLYCGAATFLILKAIDVAIGLRVSTEVEIEGLDINLHGETVHG